MDLDPPDDGGQQPTTGAQEEHNVQSLYNQNTGPDRDLLSNLQENPVEEDEEHLNLERPEAVEPEYNQFSYTYDELSKGLAFKSFVEATNYMKSWCDSNKLPFIIRDSCKGTESKPGRILFECPHGTKRKYKKTLARERQSVNYTACEARVNIFESMKDRLYKVTNCVKVHSGHMVGEEVYGSYPTVRVMSKETKKKLMELEKVGASRRRVADVIGEETGMLYSSKDIYNTVMSCKKKLGDGGVLERYLTDIQLEGGKVFWCKSEEGEVTVLWIQTKKMVMDVEKTKPFVWQTDTTFGTNREGYKVYVPLHRSCTTGRYEVSGLLFLAAENRDCVEKGLKFFKGSLNYSPGDISQQFIFFVDKDFSYIEVIRDVFPGSIVLLDDVHVDRYFHDKVFPGAYRDDHMDEVNKQELTEAMTECRMAHTVDQYIDKRCALLDIGVGLYVKPGRTKKAVLFNEYFLGNWDNVAPMWVFAYRKQLPLQGSGSTQACEAFFRVLKLFESQQFGHRSPSLQEMIPAISCAIDKRFLLRSLTTAHKRIKYHNDDPRCQRALDEASWSLNPIGLRLLNDNFKLCFKRWENMKLGQDGAITEKYENFDELKKYTTDGCVCDCSYFKQMYYCRHIPFYRLKTCMPLFQLDAFHTTLTKNSVNNDNSNLSEDLPHENSASPPSPGISMVRSEEKSRRKTASQSQKFNMAFDLAKELAEVTSSLNMETFKLTLESNKNYLKQVRKGISKQLSDYLKSPEKFQIVPVLTNICAPELRNDQAVHLVSVGRDESSGVSHGSEYDQGEQTDLFTLPRASPREDLGDEEPFDATLSNAIESMVTSTSAKANSNVASTAPALALSPLPCMQSGKPEAAVVGVDGLVRKVHVAMQSNEVVNLLTQESGSSSPPNFQFEANLVNNLALCLVCANIACQANSTSTDLFLCQGCESVAYCGKDCQRRGWRTHKHVCKNIKKVSLTQRKAMIEIMLATFEGDLNDNIVPEGSVDASDENSATTPKQTHSGQVLPALSCYEANFQSSPPHSGPSSLLREERSIFFDNPASGQLLSPLDHTESSAFTFDPVDLPEIPYTPLQKISEKEPSIKFQTTFRGKGRPLLMRQPDRKKVKSKSMLAEFYDKFPMKKTTEEKTDRQRKTRSDKGKKRGNRQEKKKEVSQTSDEENNSNNSNNVDTFRLRKPRAPKNDVTLRKQYSKAVRPENCITCHFPLDYKELKPGERVVNCVRCKSFIHQSCQKNCGFCEQEGQ